MQEYEEFSKKRDKMKTSLAALRKEAEGVKEAPGVDMLQVKDDKEALDVQGKAFLEEKVGLKASLAQETSNNQWLIKHGYQQVVTYLLHSTEFNSALGDVYIKLLNHGKHLGFVAGYKAHESEQPQAIFLLPTSSL
ncbi:hypothetical protein Hanom_Chr07g00642291 [Helianthus anomalus]